MDEKIPFITVYFLSKKPIYHSLKINTHFWKHKNKIRIRTFSIRYLILWTSYNISQPLYISNKQKAPVLFNFYQKKIISHSLKINKLIFVKTYIRLQKGLISLGNSIIANIINKRWKSSHFCEKRTTKLKVIWAENLIPT